MVDDPPDNAVALQLPELLYQHLLRDRRYRPLKIGKTNHFPPKRWNRITSFQRPSRNLKACSTPLAAVIGVCLFSLLEGEYLTFLWVLAIS